MKRTLILINVLLLALIALSVWVLIRRKNDDEAQQARFLTKSVPAAAVIALSNKPAEPVSPQLYAADTVQKFLFSRDRNPNVIEKPKVKPPEPPMPPLPGVYGLFTLGEPTILLGLRGNTQRSYHAGDQVGQFKLLAFDAKNVTFEWNGKKVERRLEELAQNQAAPAPAAAPPAAQSPASGIVEANSSKDPVVGQKMGDNEFACVTGDASPAGTISTEGYKKIETKTPFGTICRWTK